MRLYDVIFAALAYCQNDDNFKRKKEGKGEAPEA